ncbi:Orf104 [Heliothis zea nudivirus]|uniref:Orf104 n=1 Tax=Heliothis zea nudivirus 1 TaxID=3116536 RepID=Q8JKK9_9VIRU|nr:Orf104 [Heliothis zea nudivirus]AAN04398.1 Orf104 [Heliothis zea nudivirus]
MKRFANDEKSNDDKGNNNNKRPRFKMYSSLVYEPTPTVILQESQIDYDHNYNSAYCQDIARNQTRFLQCNRAEETDSFSVRLYDCLNGEVVRVRNDALRLDTLRDYFEESGHTLAIPMSHNYQFKICFDLDLKPSDDDGIEEIPITQLTMMYRDFTRVLDASFPGLGICERNGFVMTRNRNVHIYYNVDVSIILYDTMIDVLNCQLPPMYTDVYKIDKIDKVPLPYSAKSDGNVYTMRIPPGCSDNEHLAAAKPKPKSKSKRAASDTATTTTSTTFTTNIKNNMQNNNNDNNNATVIDVNTTSAATAATTNNVTTNNSTTTLIDVNLNVLPIVPNNPNTCNHSTNTPTVCTTATNHNDNTVLTTPAGTLNANSTSTSSCMYISFGKSEYFYDYSWYQQRTTMGANSRPLLEYEAKPMKITVTLKSIDKHNYVYLVLPDVGNNKIIQVRQHPTLLDTICRLKLESIKSVQSTYQLLDFVVTMRNELRLKNSVTLLDTDTVDERFRPIQQSLVSLNRYLAESLYFAQCDDPNAENVAYLISALIENEEYSVYLLIVAIMYCCNDSMSSEDDETIKNDVLDYLSTFLSRDGHTESLIEIIKSMRRYKIMNELSRSFALTYNDLLDYIILEISIKQKNTMQEYVSAVMNHVFSLGAVEGPSVEAFEVIIKLICFPIKMDFGEDCYIYNYTNKAYEQVTQLKQCNTVRLIQSLLGIGDTMSKGEKDIACTTIIANLKNRQMRFNEYTYFINTSHGVFYTITGTYLPKTPFLYFNMEKRFCAHTLSGSKDLNIMNFQLLKTYDDYYRLLDTFLKNQRLLFYLTRMLPGLLTMEYSIYSHHLAERAWLTIFHFMEGDSMRNERCYFFVHPLLAKLKGHTMALARMISALLEAYDTELSYDTVKECYERLSFDTNTDITEEPIIVANACILLTLMGSIMDDPIPVQSDAELGQVHENARVLCFSLLHPERSVLFAANGNVVGFEQSGKGIGIIKGNVSLVELHDLDMTGFGEMEDYEGLDEDGDENNDDDANINNFQSKNKSNININNNNNNNTSLGSPKPPSRGNSPSKSFNSNPNTGASPSSSRNNSQSKCVTDCSQTIVDSDDATFNFINMGRQDEVDRLMQIYTNLTEDDAHFKNKLNLWDRVWSYVFRHCRPEFKHYKELFVFLSETFKYNEHVLRDYFMYTCCLYQPCKVQKHMNIYYGSPRCGKTTLLNLHTEMCNDDAIYRTSKEYKDVKSSGPSPNAIHLKTKYISIINELSSISNNLLKTMTGDDGTNDDRTLFSTKFPMLSSCTFLVAACNHLPYMTMPDEAIRDRIIIFLFEMKATDVVKDPNCMLTFAENYTYKEQMEVSKMAPLLSNLLYVYFRQHRNDYGIVSPKCINRVSTKLLYEFMLKNNYLYKVLDMCNIKVISPSQSNVAMSSTSVPSINEEDLMANVSLKLIEYNSAYNKTISLSKYMSEFRMQFKQFYNEHLKRYIGIGFEDEEGSCYGIGGTGHYTNNANNSNKSASYKKDDDTWSDLKSIFQIEYRQGGRINVRRLKHEIGKHCSITMSEKIVDYISDLKQQHEYDPKTNELVNVFIKFTNDESGESAF